MFLSGPVGIFQPNTAPPVGTTSLSNRIAYRLFIRYHGTGQDIPPLSNPIPEFTSVIDVGDGKRSLVSQSSRAFRQTLVHRGLIPVHACVLACACRAYSPAYSEPL